MSFIQTILADLSSNPKISFYICLKIIAYAFQWPKWVKILSVFKIIHAYIKSSKTTFISRFEIFQWQSSPSKRGVCLPTSGRSSGRTWRPQPRTRHALQWHRGSIHAKCIENNTKESWIVWRSTSCSGPTCVLKNYNFFQCEILTWRINVHACKSREALQTKKINEALYKHRRLSDESRNTEVEWKMYY